MADKQGTETDGNEPGCSGWCFIEAEAECSEAGDDFEHLFDASGSSDLSVIDDTAVEQGNSLQLLNELEKQDDTDHITELKRKFNPSPLQADIETLSPRLQSVSITPRKNKKVKKVLFEDSGVGDSFAEETGSARSVPETPVPVPEAPRDNTRDEVRALLRSSNIKATLFAKFNAIIGLSFTELTRKFTSNKTMSEHWCTAVYGISERFCESIKPLLQEQCEFLCLDHNVAECGSMLLMLAHYKNQKCKDTLLKMLRTVLQVQPEQVLLDPPKTRSAAAALYWYKKCTTNPQMCYGQLPEWVTQQTMVNHQLASEKNFQLSEMVQWAYDNDVMDECMIAYGYAELGREDSNAAAFLASNNQARIVKDCANMCKLYKRAELRKMSMSAWIHKRCQAVDDGPESAWKNIVNFLRFQGIDFIRFLGVFRKFLRGESKKSCMVFWGVPDSGKSMLAMSLLHFLKGRVITFANSTSQFWLSPLIDAKLGLMDDVTNQGWTYIDVYLRGALDGNSVSIDSKHRHPTQLKFPPMLMTTNVNVLGEPCYRYLHSRLEGFHFPEPIPLKEDGTPVFELTDQSWKSFFGRFWTQLELSDQEEDGDSQQSLRVSTRRTSDVV
ncbi:putative early E1 protein [Rhinolophus ferrumequinum papillomavirus 1]|uniref:Replication protein E1 n=1 Tax=Rhinolophus ferrumequinum papillomavirus 1 TaxID=1464074 RepID=W8EG07_9PAPI|nr:putative early E1 protein [Rhinolophus ferrumequinum papillomavirus 1]AHJ81404.1 putative early E1 protein [Rhinolophus ferrumequinum papillomavirus 1]